MADLIAWLMDSPTPSIRYLTLRRLFGRSEDDTDVQAEREAINTSGAIPRIVKKQSADGNWEGDPGWYGPKYKGTHWSLMLLVELAADPNDAQLRRGVEFMLDITAKNYMLEDRYDKSVPSPEIYGFTCFWGNLLRYVAYFGLSDDPRAQPMVDYVARNLDQGGCRCHVNDYLPCAWGAVRSLWGLAALPHKSAAVSAMINKTVGFLLDEQYNLPEGAYPAKNRSSDLWTKLNFPLFYQADTLFLLRLLAELNALNQPGAQPALDWLEAQRQPNGHWKGQSPFKARMWAIAKDSEDIDRWVSLHATDVLRQAERQRQVG